MFRKILSAVTLILLVIVLWNAHDQIFEAINYLRDTNLWFILALIPEQLFMYFCAGQMFFSYMSAKKDAKKLPLPTLMRIAFELNFVNHAIPSGGVSGLGYITWRLKKYGASAGQVSFMYILRYIITVCANQGQTIIAIIVLLLVGNLSAGARWVVWLTGLLSVAIIAGIFILIAIASSRQRVDWFAKISTRFLNWIVKVFTFGRKTSFLKYQTVHSYFLDLHKDLMIARNNKKMLIRPIIWGIIYSFFEVATYWLVGMSMGHAEILPQIMVAEAIGSVIGAVLVTPGGVGGYEGAMIFIMSTLGVDVGLATAVVITTRVVVLVGTITSGYGFYQHAISKIGKPESEKSHA